MTRILHVLVTPRAEGTPNLVLDWLAAGTGHWQGVCVLHSRPADLTDRFRSAADAYEEYDVLDRGKGKFPAVTAAVFRAVRRHRPDVVICWPTVFAPWAAAGAFAAGCRKIVVHAGNPAGQDAKSRLITKYVCWPLAALRVHAVCCSRYVERTYRSASGVSRSVFRTVYNCTQAVAVAARAAAAREATPRTGRRPTAVMVATLEAHKDHATLLRAVPAILAAIPEFRLRLVGDGSLREGIARAISDLGIGDAVELLGMRRDVPELLGEADLFAFSTTPQEGLGSVLLEALAAGLPVVATDVPACRELLAGGTWGTLVPAGDSAAFARAVVEGLARGRPGDPDAAAYAASFSPRRMLEAYLDVAWYRKREGGRAWI